MDDTDADVALKSALVQAMSACLNDPARYMKLYLHRLLEKHSPSLVAYSPLITKFHAYIRHYQIDSLLQDKSLRNAKWYAKNRSFGNGETLDFIVALEALLNDDDI